VVQKTADIFYRFTGIPAKLGGGVPEDIDSRRSNSSFSKIPLQVAVKGTTRYSFAFVRF
jgi:hypothetical protein